MMEDERSCHLLSSPAGASRWCSPSWLSRSGSPTVWAWRLEQLSCFWKSVPWRGTTSRICFVDALYQRWSGKRHMFIICDYSDFPGLKKGTCSVESLLEQKATTKQGPLKGLITLTTLRNRGNHEAEMANHFYGFFGELEVKYEKRMTDPGLLCQLKRWKNEVLKTASIYQNALRCT